MSGPLHRAEKGGSGPWRPEAHPSLPCPGCVPSASQFSSLSLEGLLCRITGSNRLTGYYVDELGEGLVGCWWGLCTQSLESTVWV